MPRRTTPSWKGGFPNRLRCNQERAQPILCQPLLIPVYPKRKHPIPCKINSRGIAQTLHSNPLRLQITLGDRAERTNHEHDPGIHVRVVFIVTILALVVFIPNPTAIQYHFSAIVMSLAAGGFGTVLTGMMNVRLSWVSVLRSVSRAPWGVFVIVYFFLPAMTGF